ncbi:hypothetical protein D1BOALGB6SA_3391 [Olavius sp. associated proteobacterium Delta 1]|nr:hypothetical protein D1BOALGB6SA_3391 [Olavius sp. associated proteobacterium Delta 1]
MLILIARRRHETTYALRQTSSEVYGCSILESGTDDLDTYRKACIAQSIWR